jgi:hypothetical protein
MIKIQNLKPKIKICLKFGYSDLGFVSDFDIRISNF